MKRLVIAATILAIVLPACKKETPTCIHSWNEGLCSICGEECQHSWNEGLCSICGKECQHSWDEGLCSICGEECQHSWDEGLCSICGEECQHSGNEGVCSICGDKCVKYDEATNTYSAATMRDLRNWYSAVQKDYSTNLTITRDIVYKEGEGHNWSSVRVEGLVEGNGYTIKGWRGKHFILNIQNGGTVQNLNFEDANVSMGDNFLGAIIARVDAESRLTNCRVSGSLSTNSTEAGIVGYNEGYIANCVNEATIYAYSYGVGGIVGVNHSTGVIVACLNLSTSVSGGSNVGSIAGQNFGNIYGCLGVISTNGEGAVKATNVTGYDAPTAKTEGCVVVNSMAEVTAEHIATMNEAIASLGHSSRWVAGENGGDPTITSAE